MRGRYCLVILFLLLCVGVKAQRFGHVDDRFSCYDFGVLGGFSQTRGDHTGFQDAFENWTYSFAYGITVRKTFNYDYVVSKWNRKFDKKLAFRLGFIHFSPKSEGFDSRCGETRVHSSNINELSLIAEYNFIKLNTSRDRKYNGYFVTPFAAAGMSLAMFNVKDMFTGENLYDGLQIAPGVLFSMGGKAAIASGITMWIEGSLRFAFSDDIDGFTDGRSGPDQYYFVGMGCSFNIGEMSD